MAGLGSGSFGLANNVTQNKSYMHMKLTDSAFKSIEEYLRIKNTAASPKISFRGSEGEIVIPSRNNGTSKFSFSLQPIQEIDGPQGSFEFIKQFSSRTLESLGPMVAKLWIHAKDDSYEKTRKSMENAQKQGKMNCVKEVKNSASPFVRQRPSHHKMNTLVVPPKKKEVVAELASNKFNSSNSSTSPHRSQSGAATGNSLLSGKPPPPPPRNANGRNTNPDLVRRPLRERIIQLLAVKNYKRLELFNSLLNDGVKEKDRRQMTSVLMSVSQVKENFHHLSRHLWSEVHEDWPFYTEKEKEAVKRMKPQLTPPTSDSSRSPTSAPPLSPSSGSQGVKRPHEEVLDPTAKRPRGGRWNVSSRSVRRNNASVPGSEVKSAPQPDSWMSSKPKSTTPSSVPEHRQEARNGRHNNHHRSHRDNSSHGTLTNGTTTASTLAPTASTTTTTSSGMTTTMSPARKPSSTSPINQGSSPRSHHHLNGLHPNHNHSSGSHSPINGVTNGLTNGHANHHSRTNGHATTPPSSSPDSLSGDDSPPAYLRNYTTIVSADQRSRYKAEFNRQYQEYLKLHSFIEERSRSFTDLEEQLKNEPLGSDEYNTIRARILKQYEATQQDHDFQRKKKRYNYLHEKLTHIKRLVRDYDSNTLS